ncbi:MAG: insulinase family protein [Flavobacteriales bacterium]|nr:insulinase family protein [Flavobacteriales bacterium]
MIDFEKFTLDNGLRVLIHRDKNTPIVSVNTLYKVGARDESPEKTGFAHLFEHLMFSGSKNVPDFDMPIQKAGGQNNAFTNNDFTNYYITLPKENIETAFWLESDRMLDLGFSENGLEVQRKVVIEEFGQRYLNQPYGELWLELRPMAYKVHPYQWATIGKSVKHIEDATMEDVKTFYQDYYSPSNAILTISGDVEVDHVLDRIAHWYGDIPPSKRPVLNLDQEPITIEAETKTLERDVAQNALHLAWIMCERSHPDYFKFDLLSDILGNGKSSRLHRNLVTESRLFTQLSAYITGSIDRGLIVISGMLSEGVDHDLGRAKIMSIIKDLASQPPSEREVEKVKNKVLSQKAIAETGSLYKAMNLSYFEMLGDANDANHFQDEYLKVRGFEIQNVAGQLLTRGVKELRYKKNDQ